MSLRALFLIYALLVPAVLSPSARALAPLACVQDDDEDAVQDQRPDIAKALGEFDALVKVILKARKPDPQPAIQKIDGFLGEFEDLGPLDRASMVASLARALNIKRIRDNEEGEPEVRLYYVVVVALGEMGPESVEPLADALSKKAFQKNVGMLEAITESLSQIGDARALKGLAKLLDHADLKVFAAAARALGQLDGLADKDKKKLFKRLLKDLANFRKAVDKDPDDVQAYRRWGVVSGALMDALGGLSGHEERDVAGWQAWFGKNKKKTWV